MEFTTDWEYLWTSETQPSVVERLWHGNTVTINRILVQTNCSVKFLVYRQEGLSDTYRAVTESISIVDISVTTTETTFECRQLILTNQEQFQIEKNDVIGMCISPTTADSNAAVTLLGYSLHSSQVYMPSNINSDDCEVDMIRDVDTRTDSAHIDDVGLHLSAQINGKY